MNENTYRLVIPGDNSTVRTIIKRLCGRFKGATIKNYLILQGKHQEVLV